VSARPAARETEVGVVSASGVLPETASVLTTAPLLSRSRQGQAGEAHRAHQLQGEVVLPDLVVMMEELPGRELARVVDDPVDPTPASERQLYEAREILAAPDVAREVERVSASRAQSRGARAKPLGVAGHQRDPAGALPDELLGEGLAPGRWSRL
jgi:hypothetical protein